MNDERGMPNGECQGPHVSRSSFIIHRFLWLLTLLAIAAWVFPADAQLERFRKLKKEAEAVKGDDVPMAVIPEGPFWMGVDGISGLEDERPRHQVWLDAFSLDLYEVTTERYARFLAASTRCADPLQREATGTPSNGCPRQPPWLWESVNPDIHGDRPVIGVDWEDAEAYCRWAGKRLPTEAEWEKAARGSDGRLYPWGNQTPTAELANFAVGARFSYSQALMPVGKYEEAKGPYGHYDLAGNVWEWVQDWYEGNYYERSPERNPTGPEEGQFKVLRGGAWSDLPKYLLTYGRFKLLPDARNSYTGFRCAK